MCDLPYAQLRPVLAPGRLQKITAARLIEGLEVRQSPYSLTVQFLTVVPFFKVPACSLLILCACALCGHAAALLPYIKSAFHSLYMDKGASFPKCCAEHVTCPDM